MKLKSVALYSVLLGGMGTLVSCPLMAQENTPQTTKEDYAAEDSVVKDDEQREESRSARADGEMFLRWGRLLLPDTATMKRPSAHQP